jgi:hypothetical protein
MAALSVARSRNTRPALLPLADSLEPSVSVGGRVGLFGPEVSASTAPGGVTHPPALSGTCGASQTVGAVDVGVGSVGGVGVGSVLAVGSTLEDGVGSVLAVGSTLELGVGSVLAVGSTLEDDVGWVVAVGSTLEDGVGSVAPGGVAVGWLWFPCAIADDGPARASSAIAPTTNQESLRVARPRLALLLMDLVPKTEARWPRMNGFAEPKGDDPRCPSSD